MQINPLPPNSYQTNKPPDNQGFLGELTQNIASLSSRLLGNVSRFFYSQPLKVKISQSADSEGFAINPDAIRAQFEERNKNNTVLKDYHDDFAFRGKGRNVRMDQFKLYRTGEVRQNLVRRDVEVSDYLSIDQSASMTHYRSFQRHSWSFRTYMEESLFGAQGYYTSKVKLGNDFETAITCGSCLSHQIVNQAFIMYSKMVEARDINGERFDIVECGAGSGELAFKALSYIEELAKLHPKDVLIQKFAKAVRYTIGEISPRLRAQQSHINQKFIREGKLTIVPADARNLQKFFKPNEFKGLFVSNELPDAFPVHCICLNTFNEIVVKNVLPLIHVDDIPAPLMNEIKNYTSQLQKQYNENDYYPSLISFPQDAKDYCILPLKYLESLHANIRPKLRWCHVYLPVQLYPEIQDFLKRNPSYLEQAHQGKDFYINLDASDLMKGISAILEKGFVMTVDYGQPFLMESLEELRTFGTVKKDLNDPSKSSVEFIEPSENFHNHFQTCDMTVSICFQTLAQASKDLELIGVFPQEDLRNGMKDLNQMIFETDRRDKSEASFTVLIQAKKGTHALYGLPTNPKATSEFQFFFEHLVYRNRSTETPVRNKAALFANAWLTYEKYLEEAKKAPSLEEFSNLCSQLYVDYQIPTLNVAKGILFGMSSPPIPFNEGHRWEKEVVKQALDGIWRIKRNKEVNNVSN